MPPYISLEVCGSFGYAKLHSYNADSSNHCRRNPAHLLDPRLRFDDANTFPVDFVPSKTVGHLKYATKGKEPVFNHINAAQHLAGARFRATSPQLLMHGDTKLKNPLSAVETLGTIDARRG
jgi:hypothetical protein